MRIASFNVENMFRRPVALNPSTYEQNKPILDAYAALQRVLEKPTYSAQDKRRILELLEVLGLLRSDSSEWAVLRETRGQLVSRKRDRDRTVVVNATGRGSWIGWLELRRQAVNEEATRNTARVIAALRADVLAVVEAEDRPALDRFNRDVLGAAIEHGAWSYEHVMLIDGNDERGIDVGVMSASAWPLGVLRSHVDDVSADGTRIFSRDCAEYEFESPAGTVLVLANHFKSKGHGKQSDSNERRRRQAERVAQIY